MINAESIVFRIERQLCVVSGGSKKMEADIPAV
jgi:hypothetical protein